MKRELVMKIEMLHNDDGTSAGAVMTLVDPPPGSEVSERNYPSVGAAFDGFAGGILRARLEDAMEQHVMSGGAGRVGNA